MATFQSKPLASDLISNSQADLKGNFDFMQATLGKDHKLNFGDTDITLFEGRHTQVSLNDRGGAVAHPGDGTDSFMYSNGGQLYWRNAAVGPVQMTNSTTPVAATSGYTFLPGGLLLQWGVAVTNSILTNFSFPIPFSATAYSVNATPSTTSVNNNQSYTVVGVGSSGFSIGRTSAYSGNVNFYYMAIGPK